MRIDHVFFQNKNWKIVQSENEIVIQNHSLWTDWPNLIPDKYGYKHVVYNYPEQIPNYIKRHVEMVFSKNNKHVVINH